MTNLGKRVLSRVTCREVDKVDSSQAVVATSGAFQNLSSYINGTFANFSNAFQGSSEYISETLGVPPTVVYSSVAAVLATMSGYYYTRPSLSPYSSMAGGAPNVTEDDYSYVTSQDLDDPAHDAQRYRSNSNASPDPEDDVLLIKNRGVTYPAHFPAYTIGDGKLQVKDVKNRVGLVMDLGDRTLKRVKLLYKGRELKDSSAPVREYGVKNKSEIMAVVPEGFESSASDEEMVVVGEPDGKKTKGRRKKRSKKKAEKAANALDGESASSPRDSNSTFGSPRSPPAGGPGTESLRKLDELATEFRTKWLPLCVQYTASTPKDAKKREEEHRRISESVLQHILLKLDGVETDGIDEVRTRRKALVREVQEVLKGIDAAKASAS
ncbi:BAG domain-containing protein [Emericellopsis atlantica]|uniref:BAG domain-containing protein n=1 Tax=Emericellopsis atlantica TaxID=2614577 RepID=A0A9P7ZJ89_9HYPO|nr:BAG domain-containing protein [Emericellopsis atlantica]KAG9252941.1 BAG domain-containing protein [Emericellopsis atlantica]